MSVSKREIILPDKLQFMYIMFGREEGAEKEEEEEGERAIKFARSETRNALNIEHNVAQTIESSFRMNFALDNR